MQTIIEVVGNAMHDHHYYVGLAADVLHRVLLSIRDPMMISEKRECPGGELMREERCAIQQSPVTIQHRS